MPRFIPFDYRQNSMVVINFGDQLQPGTFEYAIYYLINHKLDLSIFNSAYKNDATGRLAYDPAILLSIILFAYSKGITSSREIHWCCENNIIFKALSCDTVPHFTTIAAFISGHPDKIQMLFEQIVLICSEQGLLGNELFAIDGCKLPSNAAKQWSGTFKELAEKRDKLKKLIAYHMAEHQRMDKEEAGNALQEKCKRTQQTIDTLNKAHAKIHQFLEVNEPRKGKGKAQSEVKSNITDNESAKMTTSKGTIQGYNGLAAVDKKHQIIVDAQAFGEGSEQHTLKMITENIKERYKRLNLSDDIYKTNAIVTADTGFACEDNMKYLYEEGINAYIPDNEFRSRDPKFAGQKEKYGKRHQQDKKGEPSIIPATEFKCDPLLKTCVCPAGEEMWLRKEGLDKRGKNIKLYFEGPLSKCRECALKSQCMKNPEAASDRKGHGRQVSFIVGLEDGMNYTDWMKTRVDSEEGKAIYSHRMSVVEPVFANMCSNKGLKRFSLRTKAKVQGQWQLFCMIHTVEKLKNYGDLSKTVRH